MPIEGWRRREDLEGGKQIRIWLRDDDAEELYVENLTYRDEGYAVYLYDVEDDEWETIAETDSRADAVGKGDGVGQQLGGNDNRRTNSRS